MQEKLSLQNTNIDDYNSYIIYLRKDEFMKIVVLDGFALNPGDLSWEALKNIGDVTIYDRTPEEKRFERAKDAEIIITNKTLIDKELLHKLDKLKYVGVLATGYNVVDTEEAKKKGIIVTNVPAYSTDSVAQMVFALLLELSNHTKSHSDAVKCGTWSRSKDFCFWNHPLVELSGKTMGIIGFGSIGEKVADIAEAFGMKVLAYSRTVKVQSHRKNFKWVTLEELLKQSDVVSLHCPLLSETKGLINRDTLKLMKKNAILINTSRGPLVLENDLADALNNGVIAGAGLDVLCSEPPEKDNPLFKAKNCIITPHIAWASKEARERLMATAVSNVKRFLEGNAVNVVNN
jgi:glycerate dehydrogenase